MGAKFNECQACKGFVPLRAKECLHCGAQVQQGDEGADTIAITNAPIYGAPPQPDKEPDREMAFLKKILSYFRGI